MYVIGLIAIDSFNFNTHTQVKAVGHKLDVLEIMDKSTANDLNIMAFLDELNSCKNKLNEIHTLKSLLDEKSRNTANKLNSKKNQLAEEITKLNQ